MSPKHRLKPADQPQHPETWAVGAVQLRTWITPEDEAPYRPFVLIVLDLDHGFILANDMVEQAPTAEQLIHVLEKAMTRPAPRTGGRRRPERVLIDEPQWAAALGAFLEQLAIAQATTPLPMLAEIARELETHLRQGRPEQPGLLSVADVTAELAGGLFGAAAEFYRAEPWVLLTNGQAFTVRFPAEAGSEWVASVMGNGGVEYGLGLYRTWEHFARVFHGDAPDAMQLLAAEGHVALMFDAIHTLPFADLETLEEHGWEVAGPNAYPTPIVLQLQEELVRRPTGTELAALEAALRAIPRVVHDHLRPNSRGDYEPLELTLSVPTHAGEQPIWVRYPAGDLARANYPATYAPVDFGDDEDELAIPDRRAMEGALSRAGEALGASPSIADPKLREAQDRMYAAWEATNPARRLSLAHEALALSADCADAYVLLAEEEADTLTRAIELFQQGMAAGERALGPAFFEANRGHFWGLLETRPYMRAREGLANALWSLERYEEAAEHYEALLALNPSDNQGVRYSLLRLRLQLNQEKPLRALLKAYKNEGTAEWLYTRALLAYRRGGANAIAERRLKIALGQNRYVPAYLTARKRLPGRLPAYHGWGDEAEAVHYAHNHLSFWRRTPGAVEWLKSLL